MSRVRGEGEEPVDRGEKNEDRAEMVAQGVESRPLQVDDRRLKTGVGADRLLEDAEVPGSGGQMSVPGSGQGRVRGEKGGCQEAGAASAGRGEVPVTRG